VALSDSEREKQLKRKGRPIAAATNLRYSDKQKLEAIHSYLALGNLALTSRVLGIPEITLRVWKASDWWKGAVEDIKTQERIELSNRMKKLIDAAQIITLNRLEHGDPVMSPSGEIVMKPVSLRDAHAVAKDMLDRKPVVDRMAEGPLVLTDESQDNKLEKLAERFAEIATKSIQKKFDQHRTVDADIEEIDSAVYEEREEGLQDGVREISFSSGTNQEPDSPDDGSEAS
jgi:hypothetical protein